MRRPLASFLFLVATAGWGAAQDLLPDEVRGLDLKTQGRYREARDVFLELLAREAEARDARSAALAEFHATMATLLSERVSADGVMQSALMAARDSDLAARHPTLADKMELYLQALDLRHGRRDQAVQRTRALGFLTQWWLIGPFPNERGTGFGRRFDPERETNLLAVYPGSERQVRWRRVPVQTISGRVSLDALVRPNDQVLCYAVTCVESDEERDVVLHLGTDESYKVFLNGVEVGGRDVRRGFYMDQDALVLRLAAGANLLMIKVCDREGDFAFAARLRALDGRPLQGVRESAEPAAIERASAQNSVDQPTVTPVLGARTMFAEGAAGGDPADALRLALTLAILRPDDPNNRRDHRLALQASEAFPQISAARYLVAFTRMRPDSIAAEREENARRHDYEAILATNPDSAETLRSLAELELSSIGSAVKAEGLVRRALEVNPGFTSARLLLATCLEAQGLNALADREIHRAAGPMDGHPAPVNARIRSALLFAREGEVGRARQIVEGVLAEAPTPGHLLDASALALRVGQRQEAVDLLRRATELAPFAAEPRLRLAALYEAEGNLAEARSAVGEWLQVCPEHSGALVILSRLHGLAGDTARQREVLAAALDLNPNLRRERRHMEFLEAVATPFFAEYQINGEAVLAEDSGPPADSAAANDPYYFLLDQRVVRAFRNGTTSEYRHFILRILTEEGANRMRQYAVPHYRGEQRARLLNARVRRPDGTVMRPRLRGAAVALPALSPGDTVEVEARVDDLRPTFFGDYFGLEHRFVGAEGVPLRRAVLQVILDPGRDYQFQSANGAPQPTSEQLDDGTSLYQYEMRDVGRIHFEERRPDLAEAQPLVRVTTWRDWNHFTSWWWNLIKNQIDVSSEMRAKVHELTDGLSTDQEKIDAIYGFVTTDIRYEAWEFGVHGYKPYNTSVIFERRHGDCKDKSLLLTAMLGEIGIESQPVLIRAEQLRSADDLSLPLVGHFNHCISYIPPSGDRPGLYLDGTATYHPSDTLPEMDRGASVLVVDGERGRLAEIPWSQPERNRDSFEYRIDLEPSGAANIEMIHRPVGPRGVLARQALGSEPGRRSEILERNLTRNFGKIELQESDTSDLLDLSTPVVLNMRFRATEFATVQGEDLVLKSSLQVRPLADLATATSRQHAMLLGVPDSELQVVRYRLPRGFVPFDLPPTVELSSPFGSFRMSWTLLDEEVRVERLRNFAVNRIQPEEYADFREFIGQVEQADRQVVVLRPRKRPR